MNAGEDYDNAVKAALNHTGAESEAEPEVVPMDDAFIGVIADCRQMAQQIEAQARGALVLFQRQHDLKGEWQVAANGRDLVRRQRAAGESDAR